MKSSHSLSSSSGKSSSKTYSFELTFEFEKQNKKYLVLENLLYQGYYIEIKNTSYNPKVLKIIGIILSVLLLATVAIYLVYKNLCKGKKKSRI